MNKFMAGALVGFAVGILIAPEKGKDLREDLMDEAAKWQKRLGKLIGKANANLDDLKLFLDKNIDGLSDDVKRRILVLLDEAEEMVYTA